MSSYKFLLFFVYLVVGLYFIDFSLQFYLIPNFITGLNKWIFLIGGVLILFGGISQLISRKPLAHYPR